MHSNDSEIATGDHIDGTHQPTAPPAMSRYSSAELHIDTMTELQLKALIHELQVHQLELSMQNEELRTTQLKLAEARDQYLELYDRAPVAYLSLFDSGRISTCNLAATKLFGVPRIHLIGRPIQEFISADCQSAFHLYWQNLHATHSRQMTVLEVKAGHGTTDVRLECQPASSDVICSNATWHVALTDITEQKNMQKRLAHINQELELRVAQRTRKYEEAQQELDSIINAVADAVITFDSNGVIEHVNRATKRLLEYDIGNVVGLNIRELLPSSDLNQQDDFIQNYMRVQSVLINPVNTGELAARTRSGTSIPVTISIARIDHQNKFTAVVRDMRNIKILQREVLKTAEDERSRISRELHDSLGQELVGISMLAKSFAAEHASSKSSAADMADHCVRFSQLLDACVGRLRQIIFDLAPLELEEGGLIDALQSLANIVNRTTATNCSLRCDMTDSSAGLETDTQLLRIAREAVHNALKHAHASHIEIGLHGQEQITLSISDDGQGMPDTGITDPNSQGIRIMQYRANLLGGTLRVEPNQPHGTRVTCVVAKEP